MINTYINLETGEFPRYEGDIRLDYPDISEQLTGANFPCPPTYAVLIVPPKPDHDGKTHKCVQNGVTVIDGVHTQKWAVIPIPQEELAYLALIREADNARLRAVGRGPIVD